MSTLLNPRRRLCNFTGAEARPRSVARRNPQARRYHPQAFRFLRDIEAGVEIDPRRLTRDHIVALREIGFNRASLGVQDFDPQVRKPCTAFSRAR